MITTEQITLRVDRAMLDHLRRLALERTIEKRSHCLHTDLIREAVSKVFPMPETRKVTAQPDFTENETI